MSGHERERLSAYLDRELPPVERAAVEAHLEVCPECAAFLAELRAVDEAAVSLPAEAPESYFEAFPARVRARLPARKPSFPARRVPAWTWAVAAALLLAVVTPLTLRQHRPSSGAAPSTVPGAIQPAPTKAGPTAAEGPRRPEPPPTARPARSAAPERQGPAPAGPAAVPAEPEAPVAAPLPHEVEARAAKDEVMAEGVFAHEPAATPAVGGVAPEAAASREKGARERLRPAAARATTESVSPALASATAGAAVEPPDVQEHEDAFRRLESVRPRSATEWRRLRDEWNAVAVVDTDPLRADEARVRAIEAAHEARRAGGDESDERAFHRAAEAYLRREDARQKPRVERLLAGP
jgi:anti-sigma factor RsiW